MPWWVQLGRSVGRGVAVGVVSAVLLFVTRPVPDQAGVTWWLMGAWTMLGAQLVVSLGLDLWSRFRGGEV